MSFVAADEAINQAHSLSPPAGFFLCKVCLDCLTDAVTVPIILDMESTTHLEAKGATMFGYEILLTNGSVITIEATNIDEAVRLAGSDYRMVLCIIDRQPQGFLAW